MPIEPLTLQFFVDAAKDDYSGRDGSILGPREGTAHSYSVDGGYTFSDRLQATAWYTRSDTRAEQATCVGASSIGVCPAGAGNPIWAARLRNFSDNFGVGLRGKPHGRVEIGADASYSDIKDEYRQAAITGSIAATVVPPPDISTKLTRVNLFGRYALEKNSGVRLDYIYDRYKTDDWTWTTWVYADGTRLTQDPNQSVNFVGISYYYRWQ
jgi:predicted porin